MSNVTPIGGDSSLDLYRITIDGVDMWGLHEVRPYITVGSWQPYEDSVIAALDNLGDEPTHAHEDLASGQIYFDREVFQLVCEALDAPQEIQDYFAPPRPSIRERLAQVQGGEVEVIEADETEADEIKTFDFMGHQLRVIMRDEDPWFVLGDACSPLGISNVGNAKNRLDQADIRTADIRSGGQSRRVTIVNESGLYDLVLDSRKPEAKKFRRWITSEVIPSINREGAYLTPDAAEKALQDPDFIIGLATQVKEAQAARDIAEQKNLALEAKREQEAPWVAKAKGLTSGDKWLTKQEFARRVQQMGMKDGLDIKQRDVYELLSQKGMTISNSYRQFGKTIRRSDHGTATANAIKRGWADNEHEVTPGGKEIVKTKISPRGINLAWKWVARAIDEHGEALVAKEDVA